MFAEKHGVERILASYDEVVNDPEVDVVYNPLANAMHAPWNLAAVAAGKPVLTEKPFARDRAEAQRVAAVADAAGVTVMEGFHYLFHPVTRRALELARDGTLGDLEHVEARMAMPAPDDDDPRWSLELAGGALMDLGCYGLHLMRRLGHPSIVRAHAEQRRPGVDAWCDVELAFPGGATGLECELDGRRRLHVHASNRRDTRRCVGAQLHQAPRRRPADHQHPEWHQSQATGHPAVVHLSTRGVRCACVAPGQIALAGESAGGGLAVALLLALREAGVPLPSSAYLLSPYVDLTLSGETLAEKREVDPVLTPDGLQARVPDYVGGADAADPYISPIFGDLRGLPPLLIQVGSHEILLSDALRLAGRAAISDVPVMLDVTPGVPHVFQAYAGLLDEAGAALDRAAGFLTTQLAQLAEQRQTA